MNTLSTSEAVAPTRADRALRALDLGLAGALLLPVALPLWLLRGRLRGEPVQGRYGEVFQRRRLELPATATGRALAALGARHWPVLLDIVQGRLAWVGPRAREPGEPVPAACAALRPGLVNPWFIRRRTAVDFGSEWEADGEYAARRSLRHDTGLLLRGALVALLPAPAASVPGRVQVGDVAFDNVSMGDAVARLREMLDGSAAQQVSFVNPACVNIAAGHRGYRRVLAHAALVLPDGIGIKIGSDLLGTPLKQNVNGTDLFPRLCDMLQARGASLFLLGGQPGVAERVAAHIAARWPGVRVAGLRHGFFTVDEEGAVAAEVRRSGAEVVLVARGVPSQDLFIDRHLPLMGVKLAIGVGGLFDFVSGRISRAPVWMRETGLEWVWRLLQEPGRMWKRYLLGNFTFLARVVLQRLGLRRPAADALPAPRPAPLHGQGVRAVVFATDRAATDLPVDADLPAALLPLGCQTAIEALMARLALAAVPDVDLVACDRPEALRALLGDGSRWGLRLHWHLVKDPARPCGVFGTAAVRAARRVIVGHADRCPSAAGLMRLVELGGADQMVVDPASDRTDGSAPHWAGWASVSPARLQGLGADLDRAALAASLRSAGVPERICDADDGLPLQSAAQLLQAQPFVSGDEAADALADVPASWIRRPWGAMSPLARVDADAVLTGPVLVGPGCIVEASARLGPQVVLSRDVVISAGTQVAHSVVLPHSYVGAGLELSHTVVNGARVRHLRLGVESTLPADDAVMLSLAGTAPPVPSWLGRGLAAVALLVAGPALGLHVALRRSQGLRPAWLMSQVVRPVIAGAEPGPQALRLTTLRCAPAGASRAARAWSGAAGLIDVLTGRRSWFGMRPRTAGEWYALRPEWQRMLSGTPVGLLHAPAWSDVATLQAEACAVADVYAAVLPPLGRLRLMFKALRGLPRAQAPLAAR